VDLEVAGSDAGTLRETTILKPFLRPSDRREGDYGRGYSEP
jgi:hypothetical protein